GLRQHRQAGLGRVAGPPDHADQREPALAAGPEAPRLPGRRNGEVPVRWWRREARGLRARILSPLGRAQGLHVDPVDAADPAGDLHATTVLRDHRVEAGIDPAVPAVEADAVAVLQVRAAR